MASIVPVQAKPAGLQGSLGDPRFAIGGPRFDALLLWGCPLASALLVWLWLAAAGMFAPPARELAVTALSVGVVILTFAHLIAVVPRAYMNREVFETHRRRLIWVPILLISGLLASPALLLLAGVVAVFWDVHHSAMQTFGLARIYDMKAGNPPLALRRTDLRLNWVLYVGPIAAGASLMQHLVHLNDLQPLGWSALTTLPSLAQSHALGVREGAVVAWIMFLLWAAWDYRAAAARGYSLPVHKAALVGSTAFVSVAAWGFATPVAAFAIVNLFHAVQYFALVWLKEGGRMQAGTAKLAGGGADQPAWAAQRWAALFLFLGLCLAFGIAYHLWRDARWLAGPFIACSLLHFWFDSFVWSVRKKQV
ncbi:MAG: hypothetical protein LC790_16235 [Actinobacteria bacterium]|nr:hypothetical protein [Actinomycetota bacterium]